MKFIPVHPFGNLTTKTMAAIQERLRRQIRIQKLPKKPQIASGVDVAYAGNTAVAVIVTMRINTHEILEISWASKEVRVPYIPGFLAFRELPAFLEAWQKASIRPDLIFFDGQGIMHPRRMGLATHASFFVGLPTVGIAKSPLFGKFEEPDTAKGSFSYVQDDGEILGVALRTREKTKPIFVSVGNLITLNEAIDLVLGFVTPKSKIPLITGKADGLSKLFKKTNQFYL